MTLMAPGIADKKNNSLPLWGNEKTMNLNNLILTNILSSHYFKVNLYQLKTYHEVIDEIYYQVTHLEPWEKGSRKTSGQTGMCGGVRGVGAGGIVSTAFCILYKLFTLKLTRKQVVGLINHNDSPYIRALGFMYIRYTQPPVDLWDWYEPYLEDEEEIDVKAGGGQVMSIGEMLRHFLSKLEWFSTLFPRIPVPIQKDLERKLSNWRAQNKGKIHSITEETSVTETVDTTEAIEDHWEDDSAARKSSSHSEGIVKDDNSKERLKTDLVEEISREKGRQRREKHGSSSKHHHHSSERHKNHSSTRTRSRSPFDPKVHKEDSKKHRSKHRDSEKPSNHRHRDHGSHHREDSGYETFYKDKKYSYDRKEDRKSVSHSHNHDKRHNHGHSHSRSRH